MRNLPPIFKSIVAALLVAFVSVGPAAADETDMDALFDRLSEANPQEARQIEEQIWSAWSRSGSPAMDLLLQRGRSALEEGDTDAAIEHFTALTDYAPDFAEGFNARATAYFQAGLYGPSLADIERVLSLNPRHFGALSGLGYIMEELGHPDLALRAFREVEALHPNQRDLERVILRLELELGGATL